MVDGCGTYRGIGTGTDAALVVELAVNENMLSLKEADSCGDAVFVGSVDGVALAFVLVVEYLNGLGDDELLAGVADGLIGQH